jgi:hypothetical protein
MPRDTYLFDRPSDALRQVKQVLDEGCESNDRRSGGYWVHAENHSKNRNIRQKKGCKIPKKDEE